MSPHEKLACLANDLIALPVGAPAVTTYNHLWMFDVHRYADGFYVLWVRFEVGFMPLSVTRRDIGRFFADPLDLVNFVLGDPSDKFVLEAQD